jgi:hypothetical protein
LDGGIRETRAAHSLGCKAHKERALQGAAFLVSKTALRLVFWADSAMGQPVRHSTRRTADIHYGDNPFHLVRAGLVKEVADTDHASGFAREVATVNGRVPKSVRKLEGIADPSDGDRDCRSPLDNTGASFALGFKLTHYRPRRWLRNVRRAAAASGWNKPAPQ